MLRCLAPPCGLIKVDSALAIILIFHYTKIAFIESDCPAGQVPPKEIRVAEGEKQSKGGWLWR
jgi:hypothetical protein